MAVWAFCFKVEDGHLAFSPELGRLFMPLGKFGFILFGIGFLLQLIHQCCLLCQ